MATEAPLLTAPKVILHTLKFAFVSMCVCVCEGELEIERGGMEGDREKERKILLLV